MTTALTANDANAIVQTLMKFLAIAEPVAGIATHRRHSRPHSLALSVHHYESVIGLKIFLFRLMQLHGYAF